MKKTIRPPAILFVGGFFLCLDQILKYFARVNPDFTYYIWKPWLGWELFLNRGIAFSLPFPNWLMILITPLLLLLLIAWAREPFGDAQGKKKRNKLFYFGVALIISGAVSNFVDRVLWGATIDYLRVLTGVINLADCMIVVGAVIVIFFPSPGRRGKGEVWSNGFSQTSPSPSPQRVGERQKQKIRLNRIF